MSFNIVKTKWNLAALAVAALFGSTCSSEQPKIACQTAHGGFSVKYTLKSGTGECSKLTGGVVRVHNYPRPPADTSSQDWARWEKPLIGILADEITDLIAEYKATGQMEQKLYAGGEFMDDLPGVDGFCRVGTMTPNTMKLAAIADPDMTKAKPAVDVSYEWSTVRFFVSPSVIGTQFTADLKYTRDGCTATYSVIGLYPSVDCEKTMTVTVDGKETEAGTGMPNEDACFPCTDDAHVVGSGIVPDIDTTCDPVVLKCMQRSAPPSLHSLQCKSQ